MEMDKKQPLAWPRPDRLSWKGDKNKIEEKTNGQTKKQKQKLNIESEGGKVGLTI